MLSNSHVDAQSPGGTSLLPNVLYKLLFCRDLQASNGFLQPLSVGRCFAFRCRHDHLYHVPRMLCLSFCY
eukprot:COSAG04_NODE_5940_length_1450_cov_2.120651_2_plen_70_part_00